MAEDERTRKAPLSRSPLMPWVGDIDIEPAAPSDCGHTPRCSTDFEHSQRLREELDS